MHGKQFRILETELGEKYTFYGFDLFFHKETKLANQSLDHVKKGLSKKELATLIADFCLHERIERFSVIGYSMGTHYATAIVEELAPMVNEYIVSAPSSVNPGKLIRYFSKNRIGNKFLEKLVLNEKALLTLLRLFKRLGFVDKVSHDILCKEVNTAELRFNLYACFTYLRFLETNEPKLLEALHSQNIKSIFIFGKRDKMYPPRIGSTFLAKVKHAEIIILDETHEMINQNFVSALSGRLL
jgi:pimeloyl-ACP methyl ester carboxylesterase